MAKSIDIVVPDLGDFADVEVIEVLVSAGDSVAQEDGLITLETDKAAMDVPAPEDGVIETLTAHVGDTLNSGDVIGRMKPTAGDAAASEPAEAGEPTGETTLVATPGFVETAPAAGGTQTLVVPDLGDFDDVEIIEVHVSAGDEIAEEEPLITLETDKAAMDVPAIVGGRIESVSVAVGD
jgi:pyruvate dehydrogenase E2 component (dihydrolipoamide acetyltransferase)